MKNIKSQKNIPRGWQYDNIGKFLNIEKGKLPKENFKTVTENSLPYLSIRYMNGLESRLLNVDGGVFATEDDLLVIADGSGSGRMYRGYRGIVSSTFLKINSNSPSNISNDYLEVIFEHLDFTNRRFRKGGAIPHFDYKQLMGVDVFIPPVFEQIKIYKIIKSVNESIAKTQKVIEATEKLKKGLMQQLFTRGIGHTKFKETKLGEIPEEWEIEKMDKHAVHVGSGSTPRGGSKVYLTEGIPFIRSQNVYFDGLIMDDIVFINKRTHNEMNRSKTLPYDVLLNITGASIGRACVVPKDLIDANVNQHVCIIRPTSDLFFKYLFYFIQSQIGQKQIFKFQIGGNREGLNFQHIRSIEFPFSKDVREQQKIAEILSVVDEKISINKKLKSKLIQFKKGLMQDLLSGKVRV